MLKRKERATMSGKMYEKRPEEDARYHDTWRLLKKYRDVTWSLELSIRQVKNQFRIDYDCSIEDFLESIYMAGADLGGSLVSRAHEAHIDALLIGDAYFIGGALGKVTQLRAVRLGHIREAGAEALVVGADKRICAHHIYKIGYKH